jgi:hypothetical protein
MDNLHQKTSAASYTVAFNELVSATRAAGGQLSDNVLRVKYVNGLKLHLQTITDIDQPDDDLKKLQLRAERLDDRYYRRTKQSKNTRSFPSKPSNGSTGYQRNTPNSYNNSSRLSDYVEPMQVDNMKQQRPFRTLTAEQKSFYRSKGWCVYCQSKEHDVDHCAKLKSKNGSSTFTSQQQPFRSSSERGTPTGKINSATQANDSPSVFKSSATTK